VEFGQLPGALPTGDKAVRMSGAVPPLLVYAFMMSIGRI